jgi:iron complex transport system substrate-binding protein
MNPQGNGKTEGKLLHFDRPPQRVVSLVPSMTESMVDLGFGEALVGITDYCIHPQGALENLPRLGGTKNPRMEDILALNPDLVLANWEENTRQTVEALEAQDISVWVTFPRSVQGAMDVLWHLTGLFHSRTAAVRLETLELSLEWARSASETRPAVSYFCPIWVGESGFGLDWWMTFNRDTYPADLLSLMGGENVFADRLRRYPLAADLGVEEPQDPGERDVRYPRVTLREILSADPELILLPDEPYLFTPDDRQELRTILGETSAVQGDNLRLVDGSLITWHGTRLARALQELPALFTTG